MISVAIIRFPGTNCEFDTEYAFRELGAKTSIIWHKEKELPKGIDLIILPGGFSYGDYLRSGAIARFSPIMSEVIKYANKGVNVLGICNGFQILLESKLLPGAMKHNEHLHFISKWVELEVVSKANRFLSNVTKETLYIPIAHAEGNYYIDPDGLKELYDNDQVILKYKNNPNGSVDSIAGITNKQKNVFGLMPHPERAISPILGSSDGREMLRGFFA